MRLAAACIALALLAIASTQKAAAPAPAKAGALPIAARALVSRALGRDQAGYQVRGLKARTRGLTARFTRAGVSVRAGREHLGVRLRGVGYGNALPPVAAAAPRVHENRVAYVRGSLEEWYENGPLGLEQGFTLRARPGAGTGPLTLALALSGERPSLSPERSSLTIGSLRYTGLAAFDERGRRLPARLELSGRTLLIRVADAGARYPVIVDPFFQVAKLTASDAADGDGLGSSVAMSSDTLVAGASGATISGHAGQGALYVFVKPPSGWANATQAAKLTASDGADGDGLGFSVAIVGDTIVGGAWGATVAGHAYQGAAYVFVKPAGGWVDATQTAKLTASDGVAYDSLGRSVSMSADTIAAGAPHLAAGGDGAVYVFLKPPGGWANATQTAKLTETDARVDQSQDNFGTSVAISGGTIAAGATGVGGFGHDHQGAAYVFVQPPSGWVNATQTAKLTASDGVADDFLGTSIAVSGDTVVAGASWATRSGSSSRGEVYVFVQPSGGWANTTETARLRASDDADSLGASVAFSGDRIVAGAPRADDGKPGAVYIFDKPSGGWTTGTETSEIVAADAFGNDAFGSSVGIAGRLVAIGAPSFVGIGYGKGAAYVFAKTTITVTKQLLPTTDPGRFDLKVGSTTVKAGAGNGGSGSLDVAPGTYTVKEVGSAGTALSGYVSSIACTLNGASGPSGSGTSLDVTVAAGDALACTITNKRKPQVTLTKHLSPSDDPGRFDLNVGTVTVAAAAGDGGSGSRLLVPGTYTINEVPSTGTSIADYLSAITCVLNGKTGPSTAGTLLQLTLAPGDVLACTFTNTRAATATLKLTKKLVPTSDPGRFDLKVGPTVVKPGAGNGGSGSLQVAAGTYSISEAALPGTALSDYISSIACTLNGSSGPSGSGTSLSVTVATGDVLACTLTNTRKSRIRLTKHLVPSSDPGRFDLYVGSTLVKAAAADGDFGERRVPPGKYTLKELPSNGTPLYNYASSISCSLNGGPGPSGGPTSMSVTVQAGDVLDCTLTNTRAPAAFVDLHKQLLPVSDPGLFDLLVGDMVIASAVGDGGQSGPIPFGAGTYTIKELATAGSGTNLAYYASSISCMQNFVIGPSTAGSSLQVTLAPGDFLDCTFQNARKARITVKKHLVPSTDPGRFDLSVDGTIVKAAAGAGAAGSILVAPGQHLVAEAAAQGASLSDYTSSIACTLNGGPGPAGPGTSLQVTAAPADQIVCTITNQRL